jgi:hypothetical protein
MVRIFRVAAELKKNSFQAVLRQAVGDDPPLPLHVFELLECVGERCDRLSGKAEGELVVGRFDELCVGE